MTSGFKYLLWILFVDSLNQYSYHKALKHDCLGECSPEKDFCDDKDWCFDNLSKSNHQSQGLWWWLLLDRLLKHQSMTSWSSVLRRTTITQPCDFYLLITSCSRTDPLWRPWKTITHKLTWPCYYKVQWWEGCLCCCLFCPMLPQRQKMVFHP